jgi:hypothetical protein
MIYGLVAIGLALIVSLFFNILQFIYRKKPQKDISYDVQALLQDLMAGAALVKVSRVAPENVFLRSARR